MTKGREANEVIAQARLEQSWREKYDVPSQAPDFKGATPPALARALFRRVDSRK